MRRRLLSERQLEILQYAADGYSEARTALILGIAVPTVKKHRVHAKQKIGARTLTQAVAIAWRRGWIV